MSVMLASAPASKGLKPGAACKSFAFDASGAMGGNDGGVPRAPKTCVEEELKDSSLPNMVVPIREYLKPKRIRSFGDFSAMQPMDAPPSPPSSQSAWSQSSSVSGMSSEEEEEDATSKIVAYKTKDIAKKQSLMEKVLLNTWDEKSEQGLFKYDVLKCPSKKIVGRYGFVAQLNEGRATKKRPTEFSMSKVVQAFDENKFNFKKAKQDEVLFQFEVSADEYTSCFEDATHVKGNASFVYINISPIEYGHVLLVPKVLKCLPQQMCAESLLTALHMSVEVHNPCFKIGFNTLGAYATINHLHFQGYFLNAPFPVECVPTEDVAGFKNKRDANMKLSQLTDYPVRAFVFELGTDLEALACAVSDACNLLESKNIPYNLLIVDCGARVLMFPQRFDENKKEKTIPDSILDTQVNPAAFEIGGHMVLKRKQDYDDITEEKVYELLSYASLSEGQFNEIRKALL